MSGQTFDIGLVGAGASAGSITAALAAGFLGSDQPPVVNAQQGHSNQGKNKLFDSWVERIDISSLLETKSGLDVTPRATRRPYLGENFELLLTVTNLRGVPYAFEVTGQRAETYDMSLHADYMHFRINDTGARSWPIPTPQTTNPHQSGSGQDRAQAFRRAQESGALQARGVDARRRRRCVLALHDRAQPRR